MRLHIIIVSVDSTCWGRRRLVCTRHSNFGLLIALAAVLVPYVQGEADKREYLTIVAKPEGTGGVIRLSADESKSRAVQIPWIVTLSNAGRAKLSVVSYRVAQLKDSGIMFFPSPDGGASDRENKPYRFR
jgi:hypothetical protein